MYWLYLIMYTFVVFVPTYVTHGFWMFSTPQTQEFMILLFGSAGFALFLLQEKKLMRNSEEKSDIQGQANRMAKDLKHSYSYIGEINRKLDILESISLNYPESSSLVHKNEHELYDEIMSAIGLFGKTNEFALRFIDLTKLERLMEINSTPENPISYSFKDYKENVHYFEVDDFIIITSPRAIDNIFACIVIKKKTSSQEIEDKEMMKTLAAQGLFLFMLLRKKNQIECVI